jgi:uncharacterized protein YjbJ (UPF0337 family)
MGIRETVAQPYDFTPALASPVQLLSQEVVMNEDVFKGQWKQLKGEIRQRWNKLTDDDIDVIGGKMEELEGRLQERYGWEKERTRQELDTWRRERELGV